MPEPTDQMYRALIDFRRRHGRYWKRALSLKWMNGGDEFEHYASSLRMLRNNFGPSWLYSLSKTALDEAEIRLARLDRLPEMCATQLTGTGEAIVIKRGETGFWPLAQGTTVDAFNMLFDATPPQIVAMEAGSMFGWNVPGADPDRYDESGRPRCT